MEIRTDPVFEALRGPLGLVDDEARRQALERYVEAARLPLERATFDLLAGVTGEIDERVSPAYRVRLLYRSGAFDVEVEEQAARESSAPPPDAEWAGADGEMEKITIRIPSGLKEAVAQAAAEAGVSVNSWFIRTLVAALRGGLPREERRIERRIEQFGPDPERDHERDREERDRDREHRRREREERRGRGSRLSGWIGGV
jgi:predicted HicB family RNase H-like nuclease